MPRCLIIYYSFNGTTARVAESIASGLRAAGYEADLCNLKDATPPSAIGYDLLGIGFPVYFYQPPLNVLEFVNRMPIPKGLKTFSFLLYGTYVGEAGNIMRKVLSRKSAAEVGYWTCRGSDIFLGYLKKGYLFSPDHPTEADLAQAAAFGGEVAKTAAGREYVRPPDDPIHRFRRMERRMMSPRAIKKFHSRQFKVDRDKCTACRQCIEQCPTGNITPDANGRPLFGAEGCILCVHCELKCPAEAIGSSFDHLTARVLMRHNIRAAARDPEIEHVRVELKNGRIRKL